MDLFVVIVEVCAGCVGDACEVVEDDGYGARGGNTGREAGGLFVSGLR